MEQDYAWPDTTNSQHQGTTVHSYRPVPQPLFIYRRAAILIRKLLHSFLSPALLIVCPSQPTAFMVGKKLPQWLTRRMWLSSPLWSVQNRKQTSRSRPRKDPSTAKNPAHFIAQRALTMFRIHPRSARLHSLPSSRTIQRPKKSHHHTLYPC